MLVAPVLQDVVKFYGKKEADRVILAGSVDTVKMFVFEDH